MAQSHLRRQGDSNRLWSRGGISWRELAARLWMRSNAHKLADRAALLSYYLLLALFPLLILLSTLAGFIMSSHEETYWRLLDYLARFMPVSAFAVFAQFIQQIKTGASGGKLSFGLIVCLWTASSGVSALIEALNVAFNVTTARRWWYRRLVALALTVAIGFTLAASLLFLFVTTSAGKYVTGRLPLLADLSHLSGGLRWLAYALLPLLSLMLIYGFGPNLKRKRWEGILPGTCLAFCSWLVASWGLRLYLSTFGSLANSYGSLAGLVALLFWLYISAAAILLGGELNAIIWQATAPSGRSDEADSPKSPMNAL